MFWEIAGERKRIGGLWCWLVCQGQSSLARAHFFEGADNHLKSTKAWKWRYFPNLILTNITACDQFVVAAKTVLLVDIIFFAKCLGSFETPCSNGHNLKKNVLLTISAGTASGKKWNFFLKKWLSASVCPESQAIAGFWGLHLLKCCISDLCVTWDNKVRYKIYLVFLRIVLKYIDKVFRNESTAKDSVT